MSRPSRQPEPPRLAEAFLRRRLPRDSSARAILGDLREDYREQRLARPRVLADAWYWAQALSIGRQFSSKRDRSRLTDRPGHVLPETEPAGSLVRELATDVRLAARLLVTSPAFAFTAIATLAVGIGATVAMFSVLDAALLGTLPYPNARELVLGRGVHDGEINPSVSYLDYIDYRDRNDVLEELALFGPGLSTFTASGPDGAELVGGSWVTANFFDTLEVEPQLGRGFTADEAEPGSDWVVVISHGYWQRRYGGSPDILGLTIDLEGFEHAVVGVMPAGFRFRNDADLWLPLRYGIRDTSGRNSHSWLIVGRLSPEVSHAQAQTQADLIAAQLAQAYPASHERKTLLLTPLAQALGEEYRSSLIVLMGATGFLLLISCGNVAGLLVAQAARRAVELSVRAALGASRGRLLRQLATESLVLAAAAGILGTGLAIGLQRIILTAMPLELLGIREIGLSGPMLGFAVLVSSGTALLFGVGPAINASHTRPAEDLKAGGRGLAGVGSGRLRGRLVVLQMALTVILLSTSGLLLRSFVNLRSVDLGFETPGLLTAGVLLPVSDDEDPEARTQFFGGLVEEFLTWPSVTSASFVSHIPIRHRYMDWGVFDPENPPDVGERSPAAYSRRAFPGYFQTMGIPILMGREHEDTDVGGPPLVVINESLAETIFPGQDPLGRQIAVSNPASDLAFFDVIGVVRDVRITSPDAHPFPQMYFGYADGANGWMGLVVRTQSEPTALIGQLRSSVRERDPNVVLTFVAPMTENLADALSSDRILSLTVNMFAAVALLLATTGMYGILAFDVARRTHEIGIRVALGATSAQVRRSVLRRGLILVGAGLAVGLPAALVANTLMGWQLFGVERTDPLTYVAVAATFLVVAVAACHVPSRRALGIDPVEALRAE